MDEPEGLEAEGLDSAFQLINLLKVVDCIFTSLNLSTTVSTEVPKRPEDKTGGVQEKSFIFLFNPRGV